MEVLVRGGAWCQCLLVVHYRRKNVVVRPKWRPSNSPGAVRNPVSWTSALQVLLTAGMSSLLLLQVPAALAAKKREVEQRSRQQQEQLRQQVG